MDFEGCRVERSCWEDQKTGMWVKGWKPWMNGPHSLGNQNKDTSNRLWKIFTLGSKTRTGAHAKACVCRWKPTLNLYRPTEAAKTLNSSLYCLLRVHAGTQGKKYSDHKTNTQPNSKILPPNLSNYSYPTIKRLKNQSQSLAGSCTALSFRKSTTGWCGSRQPILYLHCLWVKMKKKNQAHRYTRKKGTVEPWSATIKKT